MTRNNIPMPPAKLVDQWYEEWLADGEDVRPFCDVQVRRTAEWCHRQNAAQAQAAADAELEACCEWLMDRNYLTTSMTHELRAARRRPPPSLKQQAMDALPKCIKSHYSSIKFHHSIDPHSVDLIRRALESIPEDES